MKFLLLLSLLLVTSCGDDIVNNPSHEIIKYIEEPQEFEGVWYFNYGSKIELIVDEEGDVLVSPYGQVLNSINPKDGSLGTHPVINFVSAPLPVINNELRLYQNYNYTSGGDIEEDVSGSNITGNRATDIRIYLLDDGRLRIKINVYDDAVNNNINSIIATRTFTSINRQE